jgi:hypothetical protein
MRLTAGAALLLLIALHFWSVWTLIGRSPFLDETEALQAGIRMARGERIYRDFAEHHPPLVFALLSTFAPRDGGVRTVQTYIIRARILFALFGCVAIASAATLIWSAARWVSALILFISLLLQSPNLWLRAFVDVRADPPSLALWMLGAALVLLPGDVRKNAPILPGLGLGLIAQSCLWNPKWPIASAVIGIVFLLRLADTWRHSRRVAIAAVAVAVSVTLCGLAVISIVADWRSVIGNVFGFTRALVDWSNRLQQMHIAITGPAPVPWQYCPPLFHPRYVISAAVVVTFAALRVPDARGHRRVIATLAALVAATFIEICFLYPHPAPWVQYYILWSIAGAAMIALLPQAVVDLVTQTRPNVARAIAFVPIVIAALAMLSAANVIPLKSRDRDPYWLSFEYLDRHLERSDRIWTDLQRYPIGAHDANYYWFGFDRIVPAALQYAKTVQGSRILPPIGEEDLPPCRLMRGLEPNLRYIAGPELYKRLPIVAACFARLRAAGVVVPTPVPSVYEVVRKAR